jgi:hypothetical protein
MNHSESEEMRTFFPSNSFGQNVNPVISSRKSKSILYLCDGEMSSLSHFLPLPLPLSLSPVPYFERSIFRNGRIGNQKRSHRESAIRFLHQHLMCRSTYTKLERDRERKRLKKTKREKELERERRRENVGEGQGHQQGRTDLKK